MKILWLCDPPFMKQGTVRAIINTALARAGVPFGSIMYNDLRSKTPGLAEYNPKKKLPDHLLEKARKNLDNDLAILKPGLIVLNDEAAVRVVTGQKYALGTVRGSLYYYRNIPCLVLGLHRGILYRHTAGFEFELDLAKIARWATGKQHDEPAFDYTLCKTVDEVRSHAEAAKNSAMVATDRETASGFVTCTAYTYNTPEGKLRTFEVPFYDPWAENGAYWQREEDEREVWKIIGDLNASPVTKAFANGTYDCAYDIQCGVPSTNYLLDTQNLIHSIWPEAPKSLDSVASYTCDHYTYWKDENKGAKEDGLGRNYEGLHRYWRYNGMDSYYTWLSAVGLLNKLIATPYAVANYNSEFRLSVGPCLAASLRGLKTDKLRHEIIMTEKKIEFEAGKKDMKALANEPDFNVNSPSNVAWLLYDILGAKATRIQRKGSKLGPRSTDEKVLRLMKEQRNFWVDHAIDRLLEAKKPGGVLSKYGDYWKLCYRNGRFLSWHNASGTDTFRLNSGSCQFWTGTNGQNFQPEIQEMFVADPDYVFVDIDYSASDDWFIAHEAQDEDKITNLKTRDVHSWHSHKFFGFGYDKVVQGKKQHEPWVVHAITGVRQISKKVAHGKNFLMGGATLYNTAGRDMIVAAAKMLGHERAEGMSDKELIGVCKTLGDIYDHPRTGMYKRIRPWQREIVQELKDNGNCATNAFGITRKFFGNADDHETQRALCSYFGQSGTSGNVNRATNEIFYSGVDDGRTCMFVLQVHDSLKFLVHKSALHDKIRAIKTIMEKPVTIRGRTFTVPVEISVGLTDGKKMLDYRPDLTYDDLVEHERKTFGGKFTQQKLMDLLSKITFADDQIINEEELDQIENDQEDRSESVVLEDA